VATRLELTQVARPVTPFVHIAVHCFGSARNQLILTIQIKRRPFGNGLLPQSQTIAFHWQNACCYTQSNSIPKTILFEKRLNRSDRQLRPNVHAEGNDWESDIQNGMLNRVGFVNHLQIMRMSDEQWRSTEAAEERVN